MLDLLNQILQRNESGESLVVCALVQTRGSTPQKAGAVMLVLASGQTLGTIGGGCVEAEVRTRALLQFTTGASQLLGFNLDHDHGWDDGLVCGGVMTVALQLIRNVNDANEYRKARDRLLAGEAADLAISIRDEQQNTATFHLPIEPAPRLIIAGAGHVGAALAGMARLMDFAVTVIDDRPDFASAERFPGALRRIGAVEDELEKLRLDDQAYVVIVTRGHRRDALALAAVVQSSAAYVGLIGSKRKIVTIFEDLQSRGISIEQLARVHAPIGLDIGAVTPAEIAVSIAAELIAVRHQVGDRPAAPMRLSADLIRRIKKPDTPG